MESSIILVKPSNAKLTEGIGNLHAIIRADIVTYNHDRIREGYLVDGNIYNYMKSWAILPTENWEDFVNRTYNEWNDFVRDFRPKGELQLSRNEEIFYCILALNQDEYERMHATEVFYFQPAPYTNFIDLKKIYMTWAYSYTKFYGKEPHEVDFPCWESASLFLRNSMDRLQALSIDEINSLLYLFVHDWENKYLLFSLKNNSGAILFLAKKSIHTSFHGTQAQFAEEIGNLENTADSELILLELLKIDNSLVNRKAILALAKIKSNKIENVVKDIWHSKDFYIKLACLEALNQTSSSQFNQYYILAMDEVDTDMKNIITNKFSI